MRLLVAALLLAWPAVADVQLGPRPYHLVDQLAEGPLKTRLAACTGPFQPKRFSIAHRGAPLQFPEHTVESYRAAARMGAGIQECDVTFTKDLHLVCRHAQDDLAQTTNILDTVLADRCVVPFEAGLAPQCRTSDLMLDEFLLLRGEMPGVNKAGRTVDAYMDGTPDWRTDLYGTGQVLSHADFLAMFKDTGAWFTPELKAPVVKMPFNGMTQEAYAQKLVDAYKDAGIPPQHVYLQSFDLDDVLYWIRAAPAFGRQAVWLDGSYRDRSWNPMRPATWDHSMADLKDMGVNFIAPPMWVLVTLENGRVIPSAYAREAKAAGLSILTWTLERSGPLSNGGGWYYRSIRPAVTNDAAMLELLDVLAQDVGVKGVFSDWPATTTFYANCMGLD